jgi:predicted deacetylase
VISPVLSAGSSKTIVADKGQTIVIRGRSAEAGEMHLHGYDEEVALKPGTIARIKLKATIDGEFHIEFHLPSGESQVGILRVNP